MIKPETSWAAVWRSNTRKDGIIERLMYTRTARPVPALFQTQKEARAWIKECCGYIANRRDLRGEPFGWRMPTAQRVVVRVIEEPVDHSNE